MAGPAARGAGNQCRVRLQNEHTDSMTRTSTRTPTTVARAAPELGPNSVMATATAAGGDVRVLIPDSLRKNYRFPHFLPDGRHFVVARLDSGRTTRCAPAPSIRAGGSSRGHGGVAGRERSAARPGRLCGGRGLPVYRHGVAETVDQVVVRDRGGKIVSRVENRSGLSDLSLSPGGRTVTWSQTEMGSGKTDVWAHDFDRQTTVRLTFSGTADDPVWSPDGSASRGRVPRASRSRARAGPAARRWPSRRTRTSSPTSDRRTAGRSCSPVRVSGRGVMPCGASTDGKHITRRMADSSPTRLRPKRQTRRTSTCSRSRSRAAPRCS